MDDLNHRDSPEDIAWVDEDESSNEDGDTEGHFPEYNDKDRNSEEKPGFGTGVFIGILIGITAVLAAVVVFVLLTGNIISFKKSSSSAGGISSASAGSEKIEYILECLDAYYLYDFDETAIEDYEAAGIMDNLGDKYAAYYTPEEYEALLSANSGSFVGIGVYITYNDDNQIYIYGMPEGSSAAEAGILIGDIITAVDGSEDFDDLDELKALVAGEEGTPVVITVQRDGIKMDFTVTRAVVNLEYVSSYMLDKEAGIGYIILTSFTEVSADQFCDALEDLEAQGMKSLIIDLRDNGGGEYNTVVSIADRLLPEGVIFTTEDGSGNIVTETSTDEEYVDIPIVVLVNGNTASAAELLTGALKDHNMAEVIGTVTYGKGVVQTLFTLPDGSGIKFTTRMYYLPNGENIEDVGIIPDIVVELSEDAAEDGYIYPEEDNQLEAAVEELGGDYSAVLNVFESDTALTN